MAKIEIELEDEELRRLRRIAEPFGLDVERWFAAILAEKLGPPGRAPVGEDLGLADLVMTSTSVSIRLRQDRAVLLADLLEDLELPSMSGETQLVLRLDRARATALVELRDGIAIELPGDSEEWVRLAEQGVDKEGNWLDAKEIECPGCRRLLHWQLRSPFHDDQAVYCDSCPRRVEISLYDERYDEILSSVIRRNLDDDEHFAALAQALEEALRPCPCGGELRCRASRRCPHCATVLPPRSDDVGPYDCRQVSAADSESSREAEVGSGEGAAIENLLVKEHWLEPSR